MYCDVIVAGVGMADILGLLFLMWGTKGRVEDGLPVLVLLIMTRLGSRA